MKRTIYKVYAAVAAVCLLMIIFSVKNFKLYTTGRQYEHGFDTVQSYEYRQVADAEAPVGIRDEYVFRFDKITGAYRGLVFFTIHQNVDIYVDGTRAYYMRPDLKNAFGKTPGCVWNSITLKDDEAGKEIRVVIYPVYKSLAGVAPTFYYGEKDDIVLSVLLHASPSLALSFFCMLLGVVFAAYELSHHKGEQRDIGMIMLGAFAVIISLWKIVDNKVTYLLFPGIQALYLIPYFMLHLAPVPFIMFVRELNIGARSKKVWDIPIISSIAGACITIVLQVLKIADMRQTLWIIHLEILITAFVTFFMVYYEVRHRGLVGKMKVHALALIGCTIGILLDLMSYYLSNGMRSMIFAMIGFVIYIAVLGEYSFRSTRDLINIGAKAVQFEQKAYHDQLTGLNNRMAYADYTNRDEFSPQRCIIAVFDLNNLKKCNDILGHEKGDIYIKECATIIKDTFQDIGQCYRMGGDEFCVLMEQVSLDTCHKRMKQMEELVVQRNQRNPEIKMGIAYGYEMFDNRIDHNINDTSRRADKKMYDRKFKMKQEESST